MKLITIATVVLMGSAVAAAAQTKPSTTEPVPTPSSATSAAGKLPKVGEKARRHAVVRPRGEPIVKGNTDIFVDSYGQLSTTVQP